MSKRRRNGQLSLSAYTLRIAWAYELEKGRIALFISHLDKNGLAELKYKSYGGHGVAISEWFSASQWLLKDEIPSEELVAKAVRGCPDPDPDPTNQEGDDQEHPSSDSANDPTSQEGDDQEHFSSDNDFTSQEGDDQEHPSSDNDFTSQEGDDQEHFSSGYDSIFSQG
jgi:hypothetical protein